MPGKSMMTVTYGDIQMTADDELDTSGLSCPLPVLKAKKALASLQSGQTLRVIATDPASVQDFAAFCKQTGHGLLESHQTDGSFVFLLRKAEK